MKKTKSIVTMAVAAIAVLMSSCLKSGDPEGLIVTQTYPGYFNETINLNTGEVTYTPSIGYTADFDYASGKVTIQIQGLKTPDGTYPTLQFADVPWTLNSRGWQEVILKDVVPEGLGSFASVPHFDKFVFQSANRYIDGQYVPVVNITYTIDNKYQIFSLPSEMVEVGKTQVTNKADGSVYEPDKDVEQTTLYVFQFNTETKKAKITIAGAKFAKNMPAMNIRFNDVPFTTTSAGDIELEASELIPCQLKGTSLATATETPMPSFPISNLKVTYDPDRGIWVSYTCTIETPSMTGAYDVTMINQYPDMTPTTDQ